MDRNVNGIRGGAEQAGVRQKTALQKKWSKDGRANLGWHAGYSDDVGDGDDSNAFLLTTCLNCWSAPQAGAAGKRETAPWWRLER